MEQFEIIDVRPETKLRESWREFVHTHHYETHRTFFKSSLAMHPRRTEEDYVERFLKANSTKPSWVPRNVALSTLQAWYKPLVDEETLAR